MQVSVNVFLAVAALWGLASLAIVWSRRDSSIREVAVLLFVLAPFLLAGAWSETLGWHKPYSIAWRLGDGTKILAAKLIRDKGIYMYVDQGAKEPRAIVLPWDDDVARQLQEAMDESRRRGRTGAIMEAPPFDGNPAALGEPPQFHPLPQPNTPMPKGPPPPDPRRFERGA